MSQSVSLLPSVSAGLVDEFGNGLVANYAAEMFALPSALAALPQSQWYVAQWGQQAAVDSANYTQNNPDSYNPLYGNALYSWNTPGAVSAIAIYQNTAALGGGDVYQITDGNTLLAPQGATQEADMFLSSPNAVNANLSHPVTISLDAKIVQALIQFQSAALSNQYATSGTVFGTLDIGITVNFDGADGLPGYSGFVQIVPWTSDSASLANYSNGALSTTDSSAQFVFTKLLAGDPALALLNSDAGADPDELSYSVNQYVYDALQIAYANFSGSQKAALLNMANWTIGGIYVGPATNDAQITAANGSTSEAAQVSTTIQVSDVSLTSNLGATYVGGQTQATGSEVDTNPQMTYYDNTIGAGGSVDGSVYTGTVAGIQDEYLYTGADNVTLTAPTNANWAFGGGSGATDLIATSGNNELIASTGGSEMTGGTGMDDFYIPDANVTGVSTWDMIANFHTGDSVSLPGLGGAGWTYTWYAGLRVDGVTGLTLMATSTQTAGLTELVTLSGLTMADLPSLQISTSGTDEGLTVTRIDPTMTSYNLTTGASGSITGNTTPTASGISAEYLYTGQNSMAFAAPVGVNWEFGGGSAFTQLSAVSGNNIFVASTGGVQYDRWHR